MTVLQTQHTWWERLRHHGLLLSPVVMQERFPTAPAPVPEYLSLNLRDIYRRLIEPLTRGGENKKKEIDTNTVLQWTDVLLEKFLGYDHTQIAKQQDIPEVFKKVIRIGSRSETLRPHRVVAGNDEQHPALFILADTSRKLGRGRGRNTYARFLELLRGTGQPLGLMTNGLQFRLIFAGLDFEAWCEWETQRWLDEGEGAEELAGFRLLLSKDSLHGVPDYEKPSRPLLASIQESRTRQADLSNVLQENVREAVERLLLEVSTAGIADQDLLEPVQCCGKERLRDTEVYEALYQATVRIIMRFVVCLFAESRNLLPVDEGAYHDSYGVRSLYELLYRAQETDGKHTLYNRFWAWPRLAGLFCLIHQGSRHGNFPCPAYGGALFEPGEKESGDPVSRALYILERSIQVIDVTIYEVLRKLLWGRVPIVKGRQKTYVEGPVDYSHLETELIGLIYEALLDYRLRRSSPKDGPQVFLNLGREPVLPLNRLETMLERDPKALKELITKLAKEKADKTPDADDEDSGEDSADELEETPEDVEEEESVEDEEQPAEEEVEPRGILDAEESEARARKWACEAVLLTGRVPKQKKTQSDSQYREIVEAEAKKMIRRVVATGEFYLVRAGNTRKGTGTFYTKKRLAVPTAHRTLEPLCYETGNYSELLPKKPEEILELKVCDPSCGSASFLVAALHYLTDALYKSLEVHRGLEDRDAARNLTLPLGTPATGRTGEERVPRLPDDASNGQAFDEAVRAILRRHIVERCIYGVDINPLAVELARVSLWVETMDRALPFTFLDHKIKTGNALVGCWMDRVQDYPMRAWERSGGDDLDSNTKGPRTERIETFLKGEKQDNGRRPGDGIIKSEMRRVIDAGIQAIDMGEGVTQVEDVLGRAYENYDALHKLRAHETESREAYYREYVIENPSINALKAAMDRWCAVWFWPMDEHSVAHVPTPESFHKTTNERSEILEHLVHQLRFFHWELEFPDVFTPERHGFDCVLGNPPWEVMKPNSKEFFGIHDPLYRMYDKQYALRVQNELFQDDPDIEKRWFDYCANFKALSNWVKCAQSPFDVSLMKTPISKENKRLHGLWGLIRQKRNSYSGKKHPFCYQGSADLNTYKLFLEISHALLNQTGRLGMLVPSGLYTDQGSGMLRELFLDKCTWEWLFSFENRKKIFPIDSRFKFAPTIIDRRQTATQMQVAFMVHDLEDWDCKNPPVFSFDRKNISLFSPCSKSIPEVSTKRDLEICRKVYENSIRIGDKHPGWEIEYATEFHMTNDSRHFKPRPWWEQRGYRPDVFGHWVDPDGDIALPLYEGRMVGQFDFSEKGWVSGRGRSAVWRDILFDEKTIEPQFLVAEEKYHVWEKAQYGIKIGFMDVGSATNTRTFISTILVDTACGNKVPTLRNIKHQGITHLKLMSIMNSICFDFATRSRLVGTTLNRFIVEELPVCDAILETSLDSYFLKNGLRLAMVHRLYVPQWLLVRKLVDSLDTNEWKHWWAVTEADRLRLRVEIDAICADLYGLEPDDFDWIVRNDPSDPKGFWRVDKELPYEERLTGLAARAFRKLKDGAWSAETVGDLSNDEFFEILGIPEITNDKAAQKKGHDRALIYKREGCHEWHPERFEKGDPRYGWTWEHCEADAIELLGSKEALEQYLKEETEKQNKKAPEEESPREGMLF